MVKLLKFKFVKNVLLLGIIFLSGVFTLNSKNAVGGENKAEIILFYSPTCPHCHHALEFLDKEIVPKYPDLTITKYNASTKVGANYYFHYAKKLGMDNAGAVPLAIFGDKYELGFDEKTTGKKYIQYIEGMLNPSLK